MKYIIPTLIILLFSGCDKNNDYELFKSDGGKIYRIDKVTGDVAVIEGNHLIALKEQSDIPISRLKHWPNYYIPSLDSIYFTLNTTWRDGRMHYILSTSAYKGRLKSVFENLTLYSSYHLTFALLDSGDFNLLEVPISLSSMTRIVSENGEPIYVTINNSIECPIETYLALKNWSCTWNF
ncbi:MAG: hypothetical protein ABSC53_03415 [Bacteroidota bacterium]